MPAAKRGALHALVFSLVFVFFQATWADQSLCSVLLKSSENIEQEYSDFLQNYIQGIGVDLTAVPAQKIIQRLSLESLQGLARREQYIFRQYLELEKQKSPERRGQNFLNDELVVWFESHLLAESIEVFLSQYKAPQNISRLKVYKKKIANLLASKTVKFLLEFKIPETASQKPSVDLLRQGVDNSYVTKNFLQEVRSEYSHSGQGRVDLANRIKRHVQLIAATAALFAGVQYSVSVPEEINAAQVEALNEQLDSMDKGLDNLQALIAEKYL